MIGSPYLSIQFIHHKVYINLLVQEKINSIVNPLELCPSRTNPTICRVRFLVKIAQKLDKYINKQSLCHFLDHYIYIFLAQFITIFDIIHTLLQQ